MADNTSTHSSFEAPGTPIANDTAYEYREIAYTEQDAQAMAEAVGRRYVVSLKPSPACFVTESFDEELVRRDVSAKLEALKDCNVEIIIKDVSSVNHDPERLWRWVGLVKELCLERG